MAEGITDLRPVTRDRYYPVKLKILRRVFGGVLLDSLTGEDLWRHAERRKSENGAVPTIRQEFSALMQICEFGRLRSLVNKALRLVEISVELCDRDDLFGPAFPMDPSRIP